MNQAEALRIVAVVASYYRAELSDETAMLWARDLLSFEQTDAMEAVGVLKSFGSWLKWPDFVSAVDDCRKVRMKTESRPALSGSGDLRMAASPVDDTGSPASYPVGGAMTLSEFFAARPDMKLRWDALRPKSGKWAPVMDAIEEEGE